MPLHRVALGLAALGGGVGLAGCGDYSVGLDEARERIGQIPGATVASYGASDVAQGRIVRDGASVDFRVTTRPDGPFPSYKFRSGVTDSGAGCAGVVVYVDRGERSDGQQRLASAVERAVFDEGAPDAYCEG